MIVMGTVWVILTVLVTFFTFTLVVVSVTVFSVVFRMRFSWVLTDVDVSDSVTVVVLGLRQMVVAEVTVVVTMCRFISSSRTSPMAASAADKNSNAVTTRYTSICFCFDILVYLYFNVLGAGLFVFLLTNQHRCKHTLVKYAPSIPSTFSKLHPGQHWEVRLL